MDCLLTFLNSQFISATVGGLVAGLFTYLGVRMTIQNDRLKIRENEKAEIRSFCKAVQTELECVLKRYLESVGYVLGKNKKDEPFQSYYNATEEYFTVFDSNAHLLGRIKDDALRTQIVTVYTNAKGHLDSLRMNNEFLREFEKSFETFLSTRNSADEAKKNARQQQLKTYGNTLLESHSSLVQQMESLIRDLKNIE